MNEQTNDLLKTIISIKETLPKKQRLLCNYIVENFQSMGMLTVAQLAESANVGTSTVMRVMKVLGYDSFNDMKRDFHQLTIDSSLSTWWHMQESFKIDEREKMKTLPESWAEISNVLNKSLKGSLIENFQTAIDFILKAERINILGLRSSKAPAIYFEYLVEGFYPKTRQLSYDSEFIYDRILRFNENDLLFIIAHSPYTTRSIEVTRFCYEKGFPIILVTDHLSCPMTPYASVTLKVEASSKQYSIVPTMALLETLVIEIGRRTSHTSITDLEELGHLLNKMNITQS